MSVRVMRPQEHRIEKRFEISLEGITWVFLKYRAKSSRYNSKEKSESHEDTQDIMHQ